MSPADDVARKAVLEYLHMVSDGPIVFETNTGKPLFSARVEDSLWAGLARASGFLWEPAWLFGPEPRRPRLKEMRRLINKIRWKVIAALLWVTYRLGYEESRDD